VAVKKNELATQLSELAQSQAELVEACRRLAASAEVVAVAVRSPEAVPATDLDAAIAALRDVHSELVERFPLLRGEAPGGG
jgi:hypothetical protein